MVKIKVNTNSASTHRGVERSTTLNRHYVKRPTKISISSSSEKKTEKPAQKKISISEDNPKTAKTKSRKISVSDKSRVNRVSQILSAERDAKSTSYEAKKKAAVENRRTPIASSKKTLVEKKLDKKVAPTVDKKSVESKHSRTNLDSYEHDFISKQVIKSTLKSTAPVKAASKASEPAKKATFETKSASPRVIVKAPGSNLNANSAAKKTAASPHISHIGIDSASINHSGIRTVKKSPMVSHLNSNHVSYAQKAKHEDNLPPESVIRPTRPVIRVSKDLPPAPNPYQKAYEDSKRRNIQTRPAYRSPRDIKNDEIKRAVSKVQRKNRIAESVMKKEMNEKAERRRTEKLHSKNRKSRIVLALTISACCVLALGLIIRTNLPNLSVRVAAAQTGIAASYPSYTPADFSLAGVYTTNDGSSVIIDFDGPEDKTFSLSEEKSSWDSETLLHKYVEPAYGKNYEVIKEQGTTIYINHSNATWVDDGIVYRIIANSNVLTKRQIRNIVSSL